MPTLLEKDKKTTFFSKKYRDPSFDYEDIDTSWGVHGIHPYPAMMIYPIARRLLLEFSQEGDIILDPFMGSGTVLVEGLLHHRDTYGTDINPLAVLLAQVKTTPLKPGLLVNILQNLLLNVGKTKGQRPSFFNINFWFKEKVIEDLSSLLTEIEKISNLEIKRFFKVAFSEVVRLCSNTQNSEFKLMRKKELESYNPNVFETFKKVTLKNINKLAETYKDTLLTNKVKIFTRDARRPLEIEPNSIDLILTSPPYGDSKTTVAYGQFSRFSLQWLGYQNVNIDQESLGGRTVPSLSHNLPSPTLIKIIKEVAYKEEKRAREVLSFFLDLYECFLNLTPLLKHHGHFCLVVGNRRVKQVTIPTDEIIVELCCSLGFSHYKTIIRAIPNKRMPRANSPTNEEGIIETTINNEYIIILRKER